MAAEEKCARCGEMGHDRRTLFMACFYAMHELSVPFDRCAIEGRYRKYEGEEPTAFLPVTASIFAEPDPDQKPHNYQFYTLRVCKDCRGEWMAAIEAWYFAGAKIDRTSTGTGVFIRERGTAREATEEEVQAMRDRGFRIAESLGVEHPIETMPTGEDDK